MKYKELEQFYLCGIGAYHGIEEFRVGRYDKERETFFFQNGLELCKESMAGNATRVISATPLQEIDDAGLLYKYENNV
jgi:hypothetical protein